MIADKSAQNLDVGAASVLYGVCRSLTDRDQNVGRIAFTDTVLCRDIFKEVPYMSEVFRPALYLDSIIFLLQRLHGPSHLCGIRPHGGDITFICPK